MKINEKQIHFSKVTFIIRSVAIFDGQIEDVKIDVEKREDQFVLESDKCDRSYFDDIITIKYKCRLSRTAITDD